MKLKLLLFWILFSIITPVFAEISVYMNVPTSKISTDESFQVQVDIENNSSKELELKHFEWIEKYVHLWTAKSKKISIYNNTVNQKQTLVFTFQSSKEGEFTIWPVIFTDGNSDYQSNTGTIIIDNSEIIDEDNNEKMNLEDNLYFDFKIIKFIGIFVLWFTFLCIFFFVLKKFLESENTMKKPKTTPQKNETSYTSIEDNILETLNKFDRGNEIPDFYKKIQILSRSYFESQWVDFAFQKTFEEIEKNIENNDLQSIFKESYYAEFQDKIPSISEQNDLIDRFLKFLKNKKW